MVARMERPLILMISRLLDLGYRCGNGDGGVVVTKRKTVFSLNL